MAPTPLQALVDNPLGFLKENALQLSTKMVPPEYIMPGGTTFRPGYAYLKLVKTTTKGVYDLVFVPSSTGSKDKECILAFVLEAVKNKGNDDVARVDIPRNASIVKDKTFLFTVGLTGCSVVVTRVDNANITYRVFHDRRADSAVLYDNVEMCVNFDDYRIGGQYLIHTGSAITCMQFNKDGGWKMYLQCQLPPSPTDPDPLKWEVYAVEKTAKGVSREILEKNFKDRRAVLQNRIKSNANLLGVDKSLIDGAKDGEYRGSGEYNDEAIRGWNTLRVSIKNKISERRQKGGLTPAEKERLRKFEDDSTASSDADETWVWLQIKKKTTIGPKA